MLEADVATCDPVRMEVLAGARDERHLHDLRRLLARGTSIPTVPTDYEDAAAWYRTCRRNGDTVRKLVDCLIAAVAIRADVELLHADADFEALARHTPLRLATAVSRRMCARLIDSDRVAADDEPVAVA